MRTAQESARAGASTSFSQNRFQVTASAALRRRPEITLLQNDGTPLAIPLAQALDVNLHFVDRKSYQGFRIGGSVSRSQGYGDENLNRSESTVGRLEASRDLAEGKGEFEIEASYISSTDENLVQNCGVGQVDFLACYGTSESSIIGLGGLVFYRPEKNWFAMGMISAATQTLSTTDAAGNPVSQPAILMLTGFVRLAYRF